MDEVARLALELAWQEGYDQSYRDVMNGEVSVNPYKRKKVVSNAAQEQQD